MFGHESPLAIARRCSASKRDGGCGAAGLSVQRQGFSSADEREILSGRGLGSPPCSLHS